MKTVEYSAHFHSYKVQLLPDSKFIDVSGKYPLPLYSISDDQYFVPVRYIILGLDF